jgi:surface polysaccharide O-acyltransferase-like enzyme
MATVATPNIVIPSRPPVANHSRLAWLDFTRLFAAYAIVWLHTPHSTQLAPWGVLGRFAVPFFTAGAVFFVLDGLRRQPDRTFREYTANRFRRIYLPFLAWSIIYLVLKAVKKLALPDEPNDFPGIEVLWTGTYWHLWFMPFILAVTLSTFVVGKRTVGHVDIEWPLSFTMLIIGIVIAWIDPPNWVATDANFCSLAWNAFPSVCWGLALALAFPTGLRRVVANQITTFLAVGAFAVSISWLAAFGRNNVVENLAGTLLFIAALQPKSPQWVNRVGRFGSVAFGIYLAHPLVIKICEFVATKLHCANSWPLDLLIFGIAAIVSTWLAWVLARSRRTRWLAA